MTPAYEKSKCPYCGSGETISDTKPVLVVNSEWEIEMLEYCMTCKKHSVSVFSFKKTITTEEAEIWT